MNKTPNKQITCISCPIGCTLQLFINNDQLTEVKGYQCKRGLSYAENEFYNPKRMLTSTININNGTVGQLPIRTLEPITKEKIQEAMLALKTLSVEAPVKAGEVIASDFVGTGVDLIATRSVSRLEK